MVVLLMLTSFFLTAPASDIVSKIKINSVDKFGVLSGPSSDEAAQLILSLECDFTRAFNWNVKQLFVYIVAEYETRDHVLNQVVIWDHIVADVRDANINQTNFPAKYLLIDHGMGLKNRDIKFSLQWEVMPNAGYVFRQTSQNSTHFVMPSKYQGVK